MNKLPRITVTGQNLKPGLAFKALRIIAHINVLFEWIHWYLHLGPTDIVYFFVVFLDIFRGKEYRSYFRSFLNGTSLHLRRHPNVIK